ncbi:MAG: SLC13 family permease [Planctomycetota bacterium]
MTFELGLILSLLAAAVVMFALNKPRMDAVALIMLAILPFTGVVTMTDALAGFSDPNIVLIAALFVIGEGLVRTGVAQKLGDWLQAWAGSSETFLLVLLMAIVCALGATMSSTAVTAIFIPVGLRIARNTNTAPGQLMMPLSFAALISGMTTLVATAPNLVVNSELDRRGLEGFQFFSFTPFGLVILVLGILYMVLVRKWLPSHNNADANAAQRSSLTDWIDAYKLANREYRLRLSSESPLVGKTIEELNFRNAAGANIIAIDRRVRFASRLLQPTSKKELQAGDILLVDLFHQSSKLDEILERYSLELLPLTGNYFNDRSQEIGMAELIIPADSSLAGKTIMECTFRSRFRLTVIGMRHGRLPLEGDILNEKLRIGDTLLVVGMWKEIAKLQTGSRDLLVVNLPVELAEVLPAAGKAPQAVFCLLLVVGLMVSGLIPNVQAALIGCLLMGLMGCVDLNSAYQSINWKTIVLIVGMLPFSLALQETGGVELAADGLMKVIGGAGDHVILGSLFAITAGLGLFISNTATAVLMAPVALAIAGDLGASPYPFAMIVALAASTAFVTPVSSPVNTLVVGPGNYTFGDFVRIGLPFAIVVMFVCVFMVPLLLPLEPMPTVP